MLTLKASEIIGDIILMLTQPRGWFSYFLK